MAATLELVFVNEVGSKVTLRVPDCREDLQPNEVKTVMQNIIAKNIFNSTGGDLIGLAGARVVTRDVSEINVLV
ncbi:DUF2922 domain-containing protein [Desulforamulus aquiferis]|uniref:DUF2922 domain-containing protein n=1 Tax=Desulforamulus aquiferis TaxID=1397668 RepID=A0AAW7ZED7_9FIRM|nr:DUF2922 domain-containing protein [Desulforamulus aquiferis]MDO7787880.1 DUF2922 domain-containing protein [Desulforamulus aquiferis]